MQAQIITWGFIAAAMVCAAAAVVDGSYGAAAITFAVIAGIFTYRGING